MHDAAHADTIALAVPNLRYGHRLALHPCLYPMLQVAPCWQRRMSAGRRPPVAQDTWGNVQLAPVSEANYGVAL